jgi:hypothetical protein
MSLVAGGDEHTQRLSGGRAGQRTDHIVGFHTLFAQYRQTHAAHRLK